MLLQRTIKVKYEAENINYKCRNLNIAWIQN